MTLYMKYKYYFMKLLVKVILFTLWLAQLANTSSTTAYPCSVDNCQYCSYTNFCGLCTQNYLLSIKEETSAFYCSPIECSVSNCKQCLQPSVCSECDDGFYVNAVGVCAEGNHVCYIDNCLYCDDSNTCELCMYGFNNQNGYCVPNIPLSENCHVQFYSQMCQLCQDGYIVGVGYDCVEKPSFSCNVANCLSCDDADSCAECQEGYEQNDKGCSILSCQIDYCSACNDSSTCYECLSNYELQNDTCMRKIYGCNVDNCVVCATMPEVCSVCAQGYKVQQLLDSGQNVVAGKCVKIQQAKGTHADLVMYCDAYGPMLSGTDTHLQVGCVDCMDKFVNVGGFCVADIDQQSYQCNVDNCIFCVQNNYCGECQEGYHVRLYTAGICMKDYSPLPNCQLTAVGEAVCVLCEDGYALVDGSCVKYKAATCEVDGCDFCLDSDQCYKCRQGYKMENSTCQSLCSVDNCFRCSSSSECGLCTFDYVINGTDRSCIKAEDAYHIENCTSTYGDYCTTCNAISCTECQDGYILDENRNTCCQPSIQNYFGCTQYLTPCSTTCISCEKGYLLTNGLCLAIPCSISHCNYCFRSEVCIVCEESYTLNDGQCMQYHQNSTCPHNCVECDASGTCTSCLNGYKQYEGKCVCNFQNCLSCVGEAFCAVCAYPTTATITTAPGCYPANVPYTLCQIDNCANCLIPNICGECDGGYTLTTDRTCLKNACNNASHCLLCDNHQNICLLCEEGYLQTQLMGTECQKISTDYSCEVEGCGICSTSNTCEICLYSYQLTPAKQCDRITCLSNCLLCLETNTCTVCSIGYYLSTDNQCVESSTQAANCSTVDNCLFCYNESGTVVCPVCRYGFMPSQDRTSCEPQSCTVPNCEVCAPTRDQTEGKICAICEHGYYHNSYFQCVKYNPIDVPTCEVYNCLFCSEDNLCSLCLIGWEDNQGVCQTDLFCIVDNCYKCTQPQICVTCDENYNVVDGECQPNCDIDNCNICQTFQTCNKCNDTFILSENKTQCNCSDTTYTIINEMCTCPSGTTEFNNTCIGCNVDYCVQCQQTNKCSSCDENFVLDADNNVCICPQTFQIINEQCVCPQNWTKHNEICVECNIQYCSECATKDNCIACEESFELQGNSACQCNTTSTLFEGYCYLCNSTTHCRICSGENYCSVCDDSFVVEGGVCGCPDVTTLFQDTCISCDIRNCTLCQQPDICTTCAEKYTKTEGVCLNCQIDNCLSCSSERYCQECSGQLLISADGTACVVCDVDNCVSCEDDSKCAICEEGYQFSTDRSKCVRCTTAACSGCSADDTCQVCLDGYDQHDGQCTVCVSPCVTCVQGDNTKCSTCASPFSSEADSSGKCFTCTVQYCDKCSTTDTTQCIDCAEHYSLTSSNQCELTCASTLCTKCENVDVCESCVVGYAPDGGRGCVRCDGAPACTHCQTEDTSVCTTCNEGYMLEGGRCIGCSDDSCSSCDEDDEVCQEYKGRFVVVKDSDGNVSPGVCNAGCSQCSSSNINVCIECMSGFALSDDSYCIPCASTCKTCEKKNSSACLSCYGDAFLENSQCVGCQSSSNCLTCSQDNTASCTQCPYGYSAQSDNTCKEGCPNNCLSCVSDTQCEVCLDGYTTNDDGLCVPCLFSCRKCSASAPALCLDCGSGFFLNTEQNCELCPSFCDVCTVADVCSVCHVGYTLTSTFQCTKNCVLPCASCSQDDPTQCTSCIAGYSFSNEACIGVIECPNDICTVCPFGYVLQGTKCIECRGNCARCSPSNTSMCTSCNDGQYLRNEESCEGCPEGCETCSTSENCITCQSGYTIQSSPVQTISTCVKCQSPCATCMNHADICTSCVSGAELKGWKCLTTFNFGITIQFGVNFTVFYSNYYAVLEDVADAIGSTNIDVITVTGLRSGSVIMDSNVSTTSSSNSAEATAQYNSLNDKLATGTVGNMAVTSSSLEVNGGQLETPSSVNLALILVVCSILYFCCFRKGSSPPQIQEESSGTVKKEIELQDTIETKS